MAGLLALAAAVLAAVMLVRGTTASTPSDLAPAPPPSSAPTSSQSDEQPGRSSAPLDAPALSTALQRTAGLTLGQEPQALAVAPGDPAGGGCRPLGSTDDGVLGWVVDGTVASVVLLRRGPDAVPLPLSAWVPEDLGGLLLDAAAAAGPAETVTTGRADLPLLVGVARLPVDGAELVLSDLGREGGPRWAELRTVAGARCALPGTVVRRLDGTGPELDPAGLGGGLVPGTAVADLLEAGLVATGAQVPGPVTGTCAVLAAGPAAPLGVSSLVVRDGRLVGAGLAAGAVRGSAVGPAVGPDVAGTLAVGDPVDRVATVFPGLVGPGGLRALRDNSGLVVRSPAGRVVVSAARPTAVVADVDVPVPGEVLVAGLQVSAGC